MKRSKNLILSPHIDDEVLGCYTYLSEETHIMYFGVEERIDVTAEERIKELKAAAKLKKFSWQLENFIVNSYQVNQIITPIEECINKIEPETILIPHPSYNQDHRSVYDAALVALRPHDKNFFVQQVLVYEQAHTFLWPRTTFEPNFYVDLDIDEKLKLYSIYKSQVRSFRSASIIKSLADLRGSQSGKSYAEAYYCKRYVK